MQTQQWLDSAKKIPSENFNERPESQTVDLLVIHNISLPPNQFGGNYVEAFFTGELDYSAHQYFSSLKELRVSSHLYIRRCGRLIQFVPLNKRAWHAGVSSFNGIENCNDYSIGVEMEGADHIPYTRQQYETLTKLTKSLMDLYPGITKERIVGHSDIAPIRKTDPGESFDWQRYFSSLNLMKSSSDH